MQGVRFKKQEHFVCSRGHCFESTTTLIPKTVVFDFLVQCVAVDA
ncbi:hypothetical protein Pan181_00310 [Aeoliella mucimassa]|uniref:Uncharacterized protein n=1 Tax=Aeoliella mucimassa TaxID=2527972 RepID=A0A518AGI9_9BACT|nr:hypothetical protein Pan181_00310 [Aeoliella mucimassa]